METNTILESDLLLKHPFNLIISGGTGSGKTDWLARLIHEREKIINTKFERICYHYGIFTNRVLYFQKVGIETYPGVPDPQKYFKTNNPPTLLILDDLILETSEQFLQTLFTKASHHCNISSIFITQHLFAKQLKVARANTHYFVLMRNPQNLREVRDFGQQIFPKNLTYFFSAYSDSVEPLFGYLFLDLHTQSPPLLKLRTNIFENTIIYSQ